VLGLAITSQAKTRQHAQYQYCLQRPFIKEQIMAKRCDICGKGPRYGHTISHAHNLTNRRWNPNLQRMRVQTSGGAKRIKICTRCLRSGKVQKAS
jgi:large subunit ribosomal protein L28